MMSTRISQVSAVLLLAGGLALLFAPDDILPRLIPGFPVAGAWLGQLLAGAWIGIAALNWYNRSTLLGGIYGRPIVLANAALYFMSATALIKVAGRGDTPVALAVLTVPFGLLAIAYGWLMFRGPFEGDVEMKRKAQS